MPTYLTSVEVPRPGFLGGDSWKLSHLRGINVLFGKNGCGKSVLLRALRNIDSARSHYIVPERSGDISFDSNLITQVLEAAGRTNNSQGNFASNYRQQVVTRIQGYYTKRGTKPVADIHHDPDELLGAMGLVLPDFTVRVKSESPFYDLRRAKDSVAVTSVGALSSGESQLLSIGLDVVTILGIWELDKQTERVLLVDEPDAHIHPDLQIKLADFLCHIARAFNVQVFVATHSTTLLASLGQFGGDDVAILFMPPGQQAIKAEPFAGVSKEVATLLGGHILMGPLFGAPILLVEGDDDYRVWVQVARSGSINLCVLPGNGDEIKKYRQSLEKLIGALSDDISIRGFALVDSDKYPADLPPADYVPFVRLACHEVENLYLTDQVLEDMGLTWDTACQKLVENAARFGERADALSAISSIDRRTADLKALTPHIAEILDPKSILWTVRLGKVIGRGKPLGMLAEFLGAEVMEALWPSSESLDVPETGAAS
ncbi:MAG: ATP-dependent endonuclease [Gemmatimonadales bacterium]